MGWKVSDMQKQSPGYSEEFPKFDMVPVVSEYVQLKERMGKFTGLCPFHQEDTPSFCVYESHAHCYGCDWHGDAVDFIKQIKDVDTVAALQILRGETSNVPHDVWPNS